MAHTQKCTCECHIPTHTHHSVTLCLGFSWEKRWMTVPTPDMQGPGIFKLRLRMSHLHWGFDFRWRGLRANITECSRGQVAYLLITCRAFRKSFQVPDTYWAWRSSLRRIAWAHCCFPRTSLQWARQRWRSNYRPNLGYLAPKWWLYDQVSRAFHLWTHD